MKKSIITSKDILEILKKLWVDNDEIVEVPANESTVKMSIVKYLGIDFLTYKKNADLADKGKPSSTEKSIDSIMRSYASVKVTDGNTMIPVGADYADKKIQVRFFVQEFKGDVLNYYIEKLKVLTLGISTEITSTNGNKLTAQIEIGTLAPQQKPHFTALGRAMVFDVEIKLTYSSNAVVGGNNKVWLLDGVVLPYLTEGIDLEKTGSTNNIYGAKATQTLPTTQSKYYKFTLPYVTDNAACIQLQREILEGDMTQEHTLSYYDGVTYMQNAPYTAKVTLYRTNRNTARVAAGSEMDVVFAEADDQSKGRTLYEMALIDNPFDSGSVNTRWFANVAEQVAWFKAKTDNTVAPYMPIKAPNLNSMTVTSQTYFADIGEELNTLLTKNYAVIRATDNDDYSTQYFYYFIQSASAGGGNQILVNLQMDTIQTYYFQESLNIAPCVINRAHLNRWIDNGDGTVKFDGSPDSPLLNYEGDDIPKRLLDRHELWFGIDLDDGGFNAFLAEKKMSWCIILFSPNDHLENLGLGLESTLRVKEFDTGLICVVFPLNGERADIIFLNRGSNDESYWNSNAIFELLSENKELASYIKAIKITPICPLIVDNHSLNYMRDEWSINITDWEKFGLTLGKADELNNQAEIVALTIQSEKPAFFDIEIPFENTFNADAIINSGANPLYNPKFLSPACAELNITDYMGNTFSYDVQKINDNKVRILATELISADLTKGYIRLQDIGKHSIYNNGCEYNYVGLSYSNDTSIPYSTEFLSDFLSQNKNYVLMQQANRDYDRETTVISNNARVNRERVGLYTSALTGNIGGVIQGATSSIINTNETVSQLNAKSNFSKLNENLTLDNMRSSPVSLKNAQGSVLFSSLINPSAYLAFYLDIYQALPNDIEKLSSYYNMFGFAYDRIGRVKDFCNIRAYFNYIQADVETISGISLSNEVRNDIKNRFAGGIRFWNVDEVDYIVKENFEKKLTN